MRVEFVERQGGPERLLCEAELWFDEEGPLCGLKLVGFSLWRGADGEAHLTFPSRAFGAGIERRFFDYLRPAEGRPEDVRRFKGFILEAYRQRRAA